MRLTLTKQAEYALRILTHLGEAERDAGAAGAARQKAAAITTATGIPQAFATRILALLQRQGLLVARAGQNGGYVLARPAGELSVLEVIEAVEGPLTTRRCVLRDGPCGQPCRCLLHDAWTASTEALRSVLARTTLKGSEDDRND